jgi:hypothetical protein
MISFEMRGLLFAVIEFLERDCFDKKYINALINFNIVVNAIIKL